MAKPHSGMRRAGYSSGAAPGTFPENRGAHTEMGECAYRKGRCADWQPLASANQKILISSCVQSVINNKADAAWFLDETPEPQELMLVVGGKWHENNQSLLV